MNWFIPAFVSSSPDSGGGISDELGTRRCSRSSKNERNDSRIRWPSTGRVYRRVLRGSGSVGLMGTRVPCWLVVELGAQLTLPLLHRALALLEGLGDELREVEEPALRLAGQRRGLHP